MKPSILKGVVNEWNEFKIRRIFTKRKFNYTNFSLSPKTEINECSS
jgi:hypothetical protein